MRHLFFLFLFLAAIIIPMDVCQEDSTKSVCKPFAKEWLGPGLSSLGNTLTTWGSDKDEQGSQEKNHGWFK